MPLKDHAKLQEELPWGSFHMSWGVHIVERLNVGLLPEDYLARPHFEVGLPIAVETRNQEQESYSPSAPVMSGPLELGEAENYEVQVLRRRDGWQLAAVIELVTECNKARRSSRRAFTTRCAAYLQAGVSLVVVDVITSDRADLHPILWDRLQLTGSFEWHCGTGISAMSYRTVQGALKPGHAVGNGQVRLDVWPFALAVGEELPTVPLWLAVDLAVPLELELTYAAACKSLRLA